MKTLIFFSKFMIDEEPNEQERLENLKLALEKS